MEDGTGQGTGGEVFGATLGSEYIRKLGSYEGSGPVISGVSI